MLGSRLMSSIALPVTATIRDEAPLLTETQVAFFNKNGFLSVDRITSEEDVAEIRSCAFSGKLNAVKPRFGGVNDLAEQALA